MNYKFQRNKKRPFRSDFDGTRRGNQIKWITKDEAHAFPDHFRATLSSIESLSNCTLYNPIMKYPRLPRLIPLVGLETGFCVPPPRNFDEL